MKKRNEVNHVVITMIFFVFLFGFLLLFIFLPKKTFSENEKRFLSAAPDFSIKTLLSGQFGEDAENWSADHIPGRNFLVGLAAKTDRAIGLQSTKDILPGKNGRLYERPYAFSKRIIEKNMNSVNSFAKSVGDIIDVVLIPSSGFLMEQDISGIHDKYSDDKIIDYAASLAEENVDFHNILPIFMQEASPENLYYRTDHHWTSRGAYTAYASLMENKGREYPAEEGYSITRENGFYGTLYSRSCFWNYPSETIELWSSGGEYKVSFSDKDEESDTLFYTSHFNEADKYPVFLDGNHPIVQIENQSENAEGKLLIIRDSYANCLGCFLADSYQKITMVDLRYYKLPVSELCRQEKFDDVLFLYSIGNFMTDSNIIWLE